jgi:hypothetical protein
VLRAALATGVTIPAWRWQLSAQMPPAPWVYFGAHGAGLVDGSASVEAGSTGRTAVGQVARQVMTPGGSARCEKHLAACNQ